MKAQKKETNKRGVFFRQKGARKDIDFFKG